MFRVVSLDRRGLAGFLLVVTVLALTLVGLSGGASAAPVKFSAHLTATTFTSSEAGSVKLVYRFSKPSKSFAYRLSVKNGKSWQTLRSVTGRKKKGYFKGSRTTTVKKLFGEKPVKNRSYRLRLRADANPVTLSFRVDRAAPAIKLDITVWSKQSASYTLNCPAGTGTLPAAAYACEQLLRLGVSAFAPTPPGMGCTQNYEGPQTALVEGRFIDSWIQSSFDLHNGCEIARWHRLSFLFPLDAALSITVWPSGEAGPSTTYALNCPKGSGALPAAASACAKLTRLGPSAFSLGCVPLEPTNGDPRTALVTGSFAAGPVRDPFNRSNDCEVDRWDALGFLFPLGP